MAWYNNNWTYRQKVTVDNTKVDDSVTDFPVFVDFSTLNNGMFENANSNGSDIRVTKGDGTTEQPIDLASFDNANNEGELHFLADSLSDTTDTEFYIYYGNSNATAYLSIDTFGRNNVWNGDYAGVYHLNEQAGEVEWIDSSAVNGNGRSRDDANERNINSSDDVEGKFSGAFYARDNGSLITDVGIPQGITSLTEGTISGWAKFLGGDGVTLFGYRSPGSGYFELDDSGQINWTVKPTRSNTGRLDAYAATNAVANEWYYITLVVDSSGHKIYLNAVEKTLTYGNGSAGDSRFLSDIGNQGSMAIGSNYHDSSSYTHESNGYADEVRFSNKVRSQGWLTTEFNNQNNPATFYTVGAEETNGPVLQDYTITCESGSYSINENDVNLFYQKNIKADKNNYSLSAKESKILKNNTLKSDNASFTLTFNDVELSKLRLFKIELNKAEFLLSTNNSNLLIAKTLALEDGGFNYSSYDTAFSYNKHLKGDSSSYSLSYYDLTLSKLKVFKLTADSTSYTSDFSNTILSKGYSLSANNSSHNLAFNDVSIVKSDVYVLGASKGSYNIDYKEVKISNNVNAVIEKNQYDLIGNNALLAKSNIYRLLSEKGIYSFDTKDIEVLYSRDLPADSINYNLSIYQSNITKSFTIPAEKQSYNILFNDVVIVLTNVFMITASKGNYSINNDDLNTGAKYIIKSNDGVYTLEGSNFRILLEKFYEEIFESNSVINSTITGNSEINADEFNSEIEPIIILKSTIE